MMSHNDDAGAGSSGDRMKRSLSDGKLRTAGDDTTRGEGISSTQMPGERLRPTEVELKEAAKRRLTFWRNGFTIEDGALLRYDDPANVAMLEQINAGKAPPSAFNVRPNQLIDVQVTNRTQEDYLSPEAL